MTTGPSKPCSVHPAPDARLRRLPAAALLLAGACALVHTPAEARERHGSVTGAQGRTVEREVVRTPGSVDRTTTGPNGRSSEREVDRSRSGATATRNGPRGHAASRTTTRTDTGSTSTVTGRHGQSGTVVVTRP